MGVFLIVTVALAIVEKSSAQCSAKDVLAEPTPPDVPNADLLSRLPGKCSPGSFDCGEKCIAFSQVQDCVVDCDNGYDESCWEGQTRCDGCLCVDPKDAELRCMDRTGPSKICTLSPNDIFQCVYNSLNCVLDTWLMDGVNDCGDWSDENPCCHAKTNCANGFTCRYIIPNNFSCVPTNPISVSSTTVKTGSTTVSPTTVKTTPATNKTVCSSAQPQNHSLMRENPISVAILLRTGESFQGERQTLINSFPGLLTSIKSNPGRIKNYLLAPFVDSKTGYVTQSTSPFTILQSLQNLDISGGRSCYENTLTQISLVLSSLEPRSFLLIFTDADCTDAKLSQNLIKALLQKEIQANFLLTGNCTPNFNYSTYFEISVATGGEVFITNSLQDIYGILVYLSENLRENSIVLDRIEASEAQSSIVATYPIDSTMIQITASLTAKSALSVEIAGGTSVDIFHGNTAVSTKLSSTSGIKSVSVASISLSYSRLKIFAIGWPEIIVKFTSNPFAHNVTISSAPVFGVPTYLIIYYDNSDLVDLTLIKAEIHEITTTTPYFSGPISLVNSSNVSHIAGPFRPTCNYFIVKVFGVNKCGESFVRARRFPAKAMEISNFPGICTSGQLDCGDGKCINLGQFRDCKPDCSSGIDEALPMDELHCSKSYCNPCDSGLSSPSTTTTTTTALPTSTALAVTSTISSSSLSTTPLLSSSTFSTTSTPKLLTTQKSPVCSNQSWCAKANTFSCDNSLCIPQSWVLDGANDCGDGSDERRNKTGSFITDDELYQRLFNNSCANRTGMFQCRSNLCIPVSKLRDCNQDCPNYDDEGCSSSYVENSYCKCQNPAVPFSDNTDFQITKICTQHGMFMCKDKQYCVKVAYVMDGSRDCPDGSDEDPVFVDECALNKHNCSPNGMCLKIPGEIYNCFCKYGYFGNGTFCEILPNKT